jgi:hypothetical protein
MQPKYIDGGIEVTLRKDFNEFGVTIKAGKTFTTDREGFQKLLDGDFIQSTQTPVKKQTIKNEKPNLKTK